ncbi:bifunctional 3-(3-hydroxy-phenyl)propionate/3-hydroxycinnamic acid hydroxylase [Mycolicibacterium setense]|uniref:bifunctional 3-(3-hydroxy-phenyl)propionate/3-hydroxycinnamic acid hydroxylase MhpA n=1 Tax=Mycolicibacterium setense TaxID=431269 RepID=UPI00068CB57B|nr:bifunctional 3-(3-hydroxy-phenyl)propionate/3-hydroxycinnamic acid hydroxylase [Mycolicibacterium setense]
MTAAVPDRSTVVIVGAGPTGVTVATLLAQYGVDTLILDRWAQVYPQPRAVHMDDEIVRTFARLGVADQIAAISRPALGLRLLDDSMNVLAEFTRDTGLSRNGFPQANMFDQPELEALLRSNLERYQSAELRGDAEVIDIENVADRVRVAYTDRVTGTEHAVDAEYVLGCDGANSLVRTRIGSCMDDLEFEQRWLVIDVATSTDLHQWEGVHQVCDPVRAGTYMRIGATRYRWEFRLLDGETSAEFDTLDKVRPLIEPWVRSAAAVDLHLVRVTEYTFRAQLAERWRRGRVFLLGDAAHLTPPFIGQGLGAGVRDAMNLAWKLAGVLRGTLGQDVLDTYEQERKPHARQLIRLALGVGHAMTAGGDLGNLVRRVLLPQLHRLPGLNARVIDSRTPRLHRSRLVLKSRAPGNLAGTLCPNPEVAEGHRLDAKLGAGFAIVTTIAPGPEQQTLIAQRGAALHVAAPGSELARWLHRGRATAAIVRPDRTVMKAGRDIGALCTVLPTFHCVAPTQPTGRMRPGR